MKHARLDEMTKGWFVGAFTPTAWKTDACEVAVKYYKAGDKEEPHFHTIATEITLIISGDVLMAGRKWHAGDIVVMEPGDVTGFEVLTDTISVVVKTPGVLDDKYPA